MEIPARALETWVAQAKAKLNEGSLSAADLDQLLETLLAARRSTRQHLLYLHATTPNIHATVLSMALHEPGKPQPDNGITAQPVAWPYATVYDAIMDGWQVIHFPQQNAPLQNRQLDVIGYEFILQKLEYYDE